ncbi:right-handed parallel beta-helix repeat-containing protein [Sphingomonas aerolata]|uniref:right-handed parallel beta-helix repeat-containing protein n=1 Tax=Sphingomonas aerolata TaxID=185951 RepID=UPI002FE37AFA
MLVWNSTSTAPEDSRTVIAPKDSQSGRWVKVAVGEVGPQGEAGPQGDGLATVMGPGGAAFVGFKQSATSNTRTLIDRLREAVSVTDFGAKGDGITDDTAAIQRAIAYVENTADLSSGSNSPANGPQNLFIPAGNYRISDRLLITRSMSVYGDGHSEFSSGTRIVQYGAGKDSFRVEPIAQGASVSFTDLTLRAGGEGGTGGNLINIRKAGGRCNSVRIIGCTFGTPQNLSINVQTGDDYVISRCLFDVAALHNMAFGTSDPADIVTNLRITHCDFFDIALSGVLLYNAEGFIISNNTVYASSAMASFIEGRDTVPALIRNGVIANNTFKNVKVLARLTDSSNVMISNNVGDGMGEGADALNPLILLGGINTGTVITGNRLTAVMGPKSFVDGEGLVSEAVITGNSIKSTGGFKTAIEAGLIRGTISGNSLIGFANGIGHRWATSGSSVAPGVVLSRSVVTFDLTVSGARQGDHVTISPSSTAWFVPIGIDFTYYISDPNTLTLRYVNLTPNDIGVPAHDVVVEVSR